MKNILQAPFVTELANTCDNMYRLGWDERNGGNISLLLDKDQAAEAAPGQAQAEEAAENAQNAPDQAEPDHPAEGPEESAKEDN